MKLLAVMNMALVAFMIAPALSRRVPAYRSLLQTANSGGTSYNYTLEILSYTNLSNIMNTTIFALDNQTWDAFIQYYNGTSFDALLNHVRQNPSVAQGFAGGLSNYIVNGTHEQAEFSSTVQYTALAGNTLSVENTGTGYLLKLMTSPNGTAILEDNTFTILSFDNLWQGNVVHVIRPMNGTSGA